MERVELMPGISRASWMKEAKWGAFVHFLATPPSSKHAARISYDDWNRTVDAFDVEGLAGQLEEARAKYLFLTIGQCSGFLCSPNASYEAIAGPGRCSKRDLMADMRDALLKRGIRFLAYLPCHGPSQDPEAMKRLRFVPPWNFNAWSPVKGAFSEGDSAGNDIRLSAAQRNWEAVVREWSLRWGRGVSGWWFDGCYFADKMYRHPDAPNFKSFAEAARAGNPDSAIAWNPGVKYPPQEMDQEEDYTAGEINEPSRLDLDGLWRGREQYHVLSYLGSFWCAGAPRFDAKQAASIINDVSAYGGATTWDLPIRASDGRVADDAFKVLREIQTELDSMKAPAKRPSLRLSWSSAMEDSPSGDAKAGRLLCELSNPWTVPLKGELVLASSPDAALEFKPGPRIPFHLKAGESAKAELEVAFGSAHRFGETCELTVRLSKTGRTKLFDVAATRRFGNPSPPLKAFAGECGMATISASVENGRLLLDCSVVDALVKPDPERPWAGSCVELFAAAEESDETFQCFLLPEESSASGAQILTPEASPVPLEASCELRRNASGYGLQAGIPVSWMLKTDGTPERFKIAFCVSAGKADGVFVKGRVFGTENAYRSPDGFALFETARL